MLRITTLAALALTVQLLMAQVVRAGEPLCLSCPGDIDGSGFVTLDDLPGFVGALITDSGDPCADLNNDTLADARDIAPMISRCLADAETGFACSAASTAEYRVTFASTWSAATHPTDFPFGAHYSSMIGGTHDSSVSFWELGGFATFGIERMAELGATMPLRAEVEAQIALGGAGEVIAGPNLSSTPSSASTTFTVSQRYPRATVVTMIAPSPDWFVGVSGVPLFENGQWVNQVVFSLQPMDAGTDSGVTYTSPNFDTQPREPIEEITYDPFLNNGAVAPMGTFTFTRIN